MHSIAELRAWEVFCRKSSLRSSTEARSFKAKSPHFPLTQRSSEVRDCSHLRRRIQSPGERRRCFCLESWTMLNLSPGMRLGGQRLTRQLRGGDARQVFSAIDLANDRLEIVKVAALDSPADAVRLEREFSVLREAAGPGV